MLSELISKQLRAKKDFEHFFSLYSFITEDLHFDSLLAQGLVEKFTHATSEKSNCDGKGVWLTRIPAERLGDLIETSAQVGNTNISNPSGKGSTTYWRCTYGGRVRKVDEDKRQRQSKGSDKVRNCTMVWRVTSAGY